MSVGDLGELIKQSQSIVEHAQRLVEQIEVASQDDIESVDWSMGALQPRQEVLSGC